LTTLGTRVAGDRPTTTASVGSTRVGSTAGASSAPISDEDLHLLRRFEPTIRYNHGELFFPTSVEPYIADCDLWVGRSERDRTLIVPHGELTADSAATVETPPGKSLFLRIVQRPLCTARARARGCLRQGLDELDS